MTKIVNLTPHEITICNKKIPSTGTIARVSEKIKVVAGIDYEDIQIPIISKTFGNIENLPEQEDDVIYIVSLLVAQVANRNDVLAIGETIRDERGQVIGAKSLAVV